MRRRTLLIGLLASAGCAGLGGGGTEPAPKGQPEGGRKGKKGKNGQRRAQGGGAGGRGETTWTMKVGGTSREAVVFVPEGLPAKAPVVLVLHGSKGTPKKMLVDNGWKAELDKRKWIGIFPATGKRGNEENDGSGETPFLLALLDRAEKELPVDKKKVYAAGFSGGARSVYLFAAQHGDRLAAIGAGSGVVAMKEDSAELADPRGKGAKLSVCHVHGEQDTRVDLGGGKRKVGDGSSRTVEPTEKALEKWAEAIDAKRSEGKPKAAPSRVKTTRWKADDGKEVLLAVDPQLGHEWASGWGTELMCDFFEDHG